MRFAWITFRPHNGQDTHLDEFLTLILPDIHNSDKYAYVIEEAGTVDNHFHCLVSGTFKDRNAAETRFFKKKKVATFLKYLRSSHTTEKFAINLQLVTEKPHEDYWFCQDVETLLGYVLKSEKQKDILSKKIKGFTNAQILQADKTYFTAQKHKNKVAVMKNDWTLLTKKNAHNIIQKYCKEKNRSIRDVDLEYDMYDDNYSFSDLTPKAQNQIFYELLRKEKDLTENESQKIKEHIKRKKIDGQYLQGSYLDEENYETLKSDYNQLIMMYNDLLEGTNLFIHKKIDDTRI